MTQSVATTEQKNAVAEIMDKPDFMMGLNELKARANMVTEIKKQIMREGTHWGKVPGCGDKPTLLKNGAELLCMAFKLAPDAKVEIENLGNGHREYTVTTTLTSIATGVPIATGLGSCSTMESKYRYRNSDPVNTGKPVPREYWDERDPALLGGKGFMAKKDESGAWKIFKKGDKKVENPDIADVYNTVLKMASKRSLVDATLKATGGSCEFTQDIEDFGNNASNGAEFADYQVSEEPPAATAEKAVPLSDKKRTDFLALVSGEANRAGTPAVNALLERFGGVDAICADRNVAKDVAAKLKALPDKGAAAETETDNEEDNF